MTEFSKDAKNWLNQVKDEIQSRIDTYDEISESEKSQYSDLTAWLTWSPQKQSDYGAPGPIEYEVDDAWDEIKAKTRKELGGKAGAALAVAELVRDELNIDLVERVKRHGEPCYLLHDQANELDWDTEEELGYKLLAKLIKDSNLDRGTALQLYWGFAPEYYTQYETEKEINDRIRAKAFKLLKQLEQRLLDDKFKSNQIRFEPEPSGKETDAKWTIHESLKKANIA